MRTSAADIAKALSGTDFPANIHKLVKKAKENGAPEEVIETLKGFKDQEFGSMADVEHEFSRSKPH